MSPSDSCLVVSTGLNRGLPNILVMLSSLSIHRIAFELPFPPHTAYAYFLPVDEPILIDAGAIGDTSWEELTVGLESVGYDPADIAHLFITHPHTDHAGQVAPLVDEAEPTVYAPVGVRERLERDPAELADIVERNATAAGLPDPSSEVSDAVRSLKRNRKLLPPDAIDVELEFGTELSLQNLIIEPIHAPGHQENQAVFKIGDQLFAGDAIAEPFRPAALHVGMGEGFRESINVFYETLDRLATLNVDRVYPGHGPVFEDLEAVVATARDDLDALVETCYQTVSALEQGNAYQVTAERTDDPRRIGFEIYETVGALARLEQSDRLSAMMVEGERVYSPI